MGTGRLVNGRLLRGPHAQRVWISVLTLAIALSGWGTRSVTRAQEAAAAPPAQAAAQTATAGSLSPEVVALVDAIEREKDARTPTERKLDSHLLQAVKARLGQSVLGGVGRSASNLPQDAAGRIIVDITTTGEAAPQLAAAVAASGGDVVSSIDRGASVRASVSLDQLLAIAARPDVVFVQPRQRARTSRVAAPLPAVSSDVARPLRGGRGMPPGFETRAQRVARALRAALGEPRTAYGQAAAGGPARTNVIDSGQGSQTSEGDVTHLSYLARALYGADGTGIKIGVLSDGVTSLAASQASNDLGPVTVLPGQTGSGDEGTAMLEIIHDLAPGAQLYFATAFTSITSFAQNIRDLRAAGCDIIVDDVFYYVETPFQDGQSPSVVSNTNGGVVIEAVNAVTASGALYFSSAGNEGNLDDGTAGVWEGNFADGGASASPLPATGNVHHFGGGQISNVITSTPVDPGPTNLYWSDPLGASSNDYDLFLVNAAGTTLLDSSTNIQSGTQDPYEEVNQATNDRVVILKKTGAAGRFLHLNANRGTLSIATTGQTHGHSQAVNGYSVAATPAATAFSGTNVGPYPNPFGASNVTETFSSDGPRRIFFQADGTPYTPGNFSATGGILRQKPDISAADGVTVSGAGGFDSPFFGTSAAAPHAGAISALIKQARPSLTSAQIRTVLTSSAIDIEAAGVDRDSGAGIIMATAALQAAGATAAGAGLVMDSFTAAENPGNGDGVISGGEGARLTIALQNVGTASATAISATLTTSTPGVTITQPADRSYPTIASGAIVSNAVPWTFTVPSNAACDLTIYFTLTLTFTGGPSATEVLHLPLRLGATVDINTTLDTTAPPSATLYTASTGTQAGRIARNGIVSSCAAPKTYPGLVATTGTRQYDAYQFNSCPSLGSTCNPISLDSASGANIFTVAYAPTFNPASLGTNYAGDPGTSSNTQAFSINTGTNPSFVVEVHEINPGGGIGTVYHLRVTGLCSASCTRNGVPTAVAQNVTAVADAAGTANVSINNGSSDPDGNPLTMTQSPAGPYPVGVTSVLLTVSDPSGATSQATGTVTVVPSVTTIAPASGPTAGGTAVTITGTGFSTTPGATTVMFGAVAATSVTCASTTQCQATSPAAAGAGVVSVRVTAGGQTSADTAVDDFTYTTLTYLLAEGATGGFFDEDLLIANPNTTAAPVTLKFFKEDASTVTDTRTLPAQSRTTVHVDALPGLEATAASVEVTSSSGLPLAVERSMFWDSTYYGGHTAGAVNAPAQTWYFAEGSQGFFDTYVLVVNPSAVAASVTMTFLREGEVPVVKTFPIGASSRLTVWAGNIPELVNRSFAIKIEATTPVITERSMYFGNTPTRLWSGGHASGGNALSQQWYYGEGATGGFFDTFILLGNPQSVDANVTVKYLLDTGDVITVPKVVPANARLTINVEGEPDPRLANAAFSTLVTSDVPIVSERSMYWPGEVLPWGEAHNSAGVNTLGTRWGLAEGRVGGPHNFHTYILLGNPQSTAANVTVTYLREGGAAPVVKTYTVPATSRFNIDVNSVVPELVDESFGAKIEVTNGVNIIVERSMYWDANGIFWSGGSNATGVPLP